MTEIETRHDLGFRAEWALARARRGALRCRPGVLLESRDGMTARVQPDGFAHAEGFLLSGPDFRDPATLAALRAEAAACLGRDCSHDYAPAIVAALETAFPIGPT